NFIHLIDNVIVRDDVALIRHDDSRTKRILHEGLVIWVSKLSLLVTKEKLKGIETVLPPDVDLLGRFHRDDGWDHATDERAPLPVQCVKRCNLLWIHVRRRSQRVLLRRSSRRQIQRPMFEAIIVEQRNSRAN